MRSSSEPRPATRRGPQIGISYPVPPRESRRPGGSRPLSAPGRSRRGSALRPMTAPVARRSWTASEHWGPTRGSSAPPSASRMVVPRSTDVTTPFMRSTITPRRSPWALMRWGFAVAHVRQAVHVWRRDADRLVRRANTGYLAAAPPAFDPHNRCRARVTCFRSATAARCSPRWSSRDLAGWLEATGVRGRPNRLSRARRRGSSWHRRTNPN